MKELKRLSTGFLSALMILSFILMPIPQTNRAWAGDDVESPCDEEGAQRTAEYPGESVGEFNKGRKKKNHISQEVWQQKKDAYDEYSGKNGLYTAGCDMTDAMSRASLDNPAMYKDGKIAQLLEQYVMGLFGLTMINGFMWKYLYKYNPAIYGQDCPGNWGPRWTMPLTALSGLAYVIGDAQANVKFKIASKKATDAAFSAKSRNHIPTADSDAVKEAQEKGEVDPRIQAIMDNRTQEEAYDVLISVLEAQKAAVKTKRTLTRISNVGYYVATGLELTNLLICNGLCAKDQAEKLGTEAALPALATAAGSALTLAIKSNPACGAALTQNAAAAAMIGVDKGLMETYAGIDATAAAVGSIEKMNFFKKAWESIRGIFSSAAPAAVISQQISDVFIGKAVETSKDIAKQTAENAKITASLKTETQLSALNTSVVASCSDPLAIKAVHTFVTAYSKWLITPIECCGGNGLSIVSYLTLKKAKQLGSVSNPELMAFLEANEARMKAKQLKAADLVGFVTAMPGTLGVQGPPLKSVFETRKDIKIGGLFGGVVDFEDPKVKELLKDRKEFVRTVMRSGIEHFMLNLYSDKQMQNPKEYVKIVAENNRKIDIVMEKFDKEILDDLNIQIVKNNYDGIQEKMKSFVHKISSILVPKAHAGMGLAVGGMLLTMVGNQVENPWIKEIFNLGGKLMMLQGLLGKLMKDYALNRPVGRNITWALMGGIGEFVIASLKKTEKKIENNLTIVKTEKKRFMNSSVARGGLAGDKVITGDGTLNLQDYDPSSSRNNSMKIRACATPKADGSFAPAMCPAVIPKQRFSLPEIKGKAMNHLTPDFLKGMSMMSDYAYSASSGSLDGETMSGSELAGIENLSRAMAAHNELLRDKVDKHNSKIKLKNGKKYPSLKSTIASFRKGFGSTGGSSGGGFGGGVSSSPYRGGKKEVKNIVNNGAPKKKGTTSGGSTAAAKIPGFDLDFGDDEEAGIVNADGTTAAGSNGAKATEKLDDFVLKHDDINKRKEIPIWKILSNRYILSYPKILDEEDAKLEPDKIEKKKK